MATIYSKAHLVKFENLKKRKGYGRLTKISSLLGIILLIKSPAPIVAAEESPISLMDENNN